MKNTRFNPVLVDNINDGDELASVWAIVDQADTAVLNKPCETLAKAK